MYRARVINIMSNTQLIIDYGINNGAEIGEVVRVIEQGEIVKDLKGKSLGTLDAIKETLEITEVYENFSICQKIIREEYPNPITMALSQFNARQTQETVSEINVDAGDITNLAPPTKKPIKTGDIVEIL